MVRSTTTGTASTTSSTTPASTTSVSTVTSGTTTTVTMVPPEFGRLSTLIKRTSFSKDRAVDLAEAEECRRLFRVGNLMLAEVPLAVENLNKVLTSSPDIAVTLKNKEDLLDKNEAMINSILARRADDFNNEVDIMNEIRRQFDLGTSTVSEVNTQFKTMYRELIDLCSSDLLSLNPQEWEAKQPSSFNAIFNSEKIEKVYKLLKTLKGKIIKLTTSMSVAGTLGTRSLISKWSSIVYDSLRVLDDVATKHLPYEDADKIHVWWLIAALNGKSKSEIDPYIVQANEGAELLLYVISIYDRVRSCLKKTENDHLAKLFHIEDFLVEPKDPPEPPFTMKASKLLRKDISLISENMIPTWL